ncbi:MAG TPA: tetratricopeptide repeat protein, partial [Stellaceae bacterium]|nr:tetratricopeptide repeat protein [Stellaceae bacterium]
MIRVFAKLVVWLSLLSSLSGTLARADSADDTRALNRQVVGLVTAHRFDEAKPLAEQALKLCANTGNVRVYCESQFLELLGDIARGQGKIPEALASYQKAEQVREAGLNPNDYAIGMGQLHLGVFFNELHRDADEEVALKRATNILGQIPQAAENY